MGSSFPLFLFTVLLRPISISCCDLFDRLDLIQTSKLPFFFMILIPFGTVSRPLQLIVSPLFDLLTVLLPLEDSKAFISWMALISFSKMLNFFQRLYRLTRFFMTRKNIRLRDRLFFGGSFVFVFDFVFFLLLFSHSLQHL